MAAISLLFPMILTMALFAPRAHAVAESVYDLPANNVAIQGRRYEMSNSFLVSAGYLPTDSFNRGYAFAGAYRRALASYFVLEASYSWVSNQKTNLEDELKSTGVQVQNVGLGGVLDYPKQIYMLGLHYAPMYSKSLLFNSRLVYSESSFFIGAGSINFNQNGYKMMFAPGLATRLYLGPSWAMVGYFRDYFYMDDSRGITGIIDFGLGFEFKFGGERPSDAAAATL